MKLSIIMPIHNLDNRYLSKCLESILNQEFCDFELLCINDCSPNLENAVLLSSYVAKDFRIKLINLEKNVGAAAARNVGLDHLQGEFVAFVDGDDYLDLDYYQKLMAIMENESADLLMCGFARVNDYGKVLKVREPANLVATSLQDNNKVLQFKELSYGLWNKIYRASLVKNLRFLSGVRLAEDVHFNFNAFLLADKSVSTNQVRYNYRLNHQSVTSNERDGVTTITTNLTVLSYLLIDYARIKDKLDVSPKLNQEIIHYFYYRFIRYANKFGRIKDRELAQELWREYTKFFANDFVKIANEKRFFYRLMALSFGNKRRLSMIKLKVLIYSRLLALAK